MLENINLIAQSAIRIVNNNKIYYFDPYQISNSGEKYENDADYIFITHSHYDHFSPEDIKLIKNNNTKIIIPSDLVDKVLSLGFDSESVLIVSPNNNYVIDDLSFITIPSYNINKSFHKKEYNWVGYIVNIDNVVVYVAGDTDNIEEAQKVKCDIACVPIGGTYTMNYLEAVDLIKKINPKTAIPIHYKTIVGSVEDAYNFKKELEGMVNVLILMK